MGGQGGRGRTIRTVAPKAPPTGARPTDARTRAPSREPDSPMRLTRTPVEILRRYTVPVTAGVTHFFTLRGADCVGSAYDAAGATASGTVRWAARY